MHCHDDGESQGICEAHHTREHTAELPSKADGLALLSLGPEQVEEESQSKDGGDVNADEDIVRGNADEVVVVDFGRAM